MAAAEKRAASATNEPSAESKEDSNRSLSWEHWN